MTISDYNIIKFLGQGGFGRVYEAENLLDKKRYAIKTIRITNGERDVVLREAQALAQLGEHQNITTYYNCWLSEEDIVISNKQDATDWFSKTNGLPEQGVHEGTSEYWSSAADCDPDSKDNSGSTVKFTSTNFLYIQMGLYGRTLRNWLKHKEGPTDSYENLLRMSLQIIVGLAWIHRAKLMHRDLKPENIFVTTLGGTFCLKLGDFGLVTGGKNTNKKGRTSGVGTYPYAAPEMYRQSHGNYNNMVDVYALGVIIFELFYSMRTDMEKCDLIDKATEQKCVPPNLETNHPNESKWILEMLSLDAVGRPRLPKIKHWIKTSLRHAGDGEIFE